jgi:hypothetical protein
VRVAIRRTLAWMGQAQSLAESLRSLELLGKAAGRLANMMKIQHELRSTLGEPTPSIDEDLDQVIQELSLE